MKRGLIFRLVELALGVIVGYVAYLAIGEADPIGATLGVVIGLLTAILASSIVSTYEQKANNERLESRLDKVLEKLGDRLAAHHEIMHLLRYAKLRFRRESIVTVFHQILWGTQRRYWATSYQVASEVAIHRLGMAIQEAKAKVDGVEIRRIYIVDADEEVAALAELIRAQRSVGIDARYLRRSDIEANPILRDRVQLMPSLDFTLVDSRFIWFLHLDKDRRLVEEELSFDDAACHDAEELYKDLFSIATTPNSGLIGTPQSGAVAVT